jgi:sec-independent protein translocase protein TatA
VNIGPVQILIIALVILILFGRGRISEMMGDFGKGVKSFRKGLSEEDEAGRKQAQIVHDAKPAETAESAPADKTNQ